MAQTFASELCSIACFSPPLNRFCSDIMWSKCMEALLRLSFLYLHLEIRTFPQTNFTHKCRKFLIWVRVKPLLRLYTRLIKNFCTGANRNEQTFSFTEILLLDTTFVRFCTTLPELTTFNSNLLLERDQQLFPTVRRN